MHRKAPSDPKKADPKQADLKQVTAVTRKPMPADLIAVSTEVDLPPQFKNLKDPLITDDYFVDDHKDDYVALYPRQPGLLGTEIKLIHQGKPSFNYGIQIQDGKEGTVPCVATVSNESVRVWKCVDLKAGELTKPFKEWKFAEELTLPGWRGVKAKRAKNHRTTAAVCHDQKTMIIQILYLDTKQKTCYQEKGGLEVIDLETGKRFRKWSSFYECHFKFEVSPCRKDRNKVTLVADFSYFDNFSGHNWRNNKVTTIDLSQRKDSILEWEHELEAKDRVFDKWLNDYSWYDPNWWISVTPNQPALQLYIPVFQRVMEHRPRAYELLNPEDYGSYSFPDFPHIADVRRSGKSESQFFTWRDEMLQAVQVYPASHLEGYKFAVSEPTGFPPALSGLVLEYSIFRLKPDPKLLHPGIFSTELLRKIMRFLSILPDPDYFIFHCRDIDYSKLEILKEKQKNSLTILSNLLKKLNKLKAHHHVFTEQEVLDLFPDPAVKLPEKDNPVLPEVEEVINEMRAEMLEYVKTNQAECRPG